MRKISIVYHSGYGHTSNQANGIASGMESVEGVTTHPIAIGQDGEITESAKRDDINYLGSFGGLMAQSPSDAGTDEAPTTGDIETAKVFGIRVATVIRDLLR